MNIKTFVVASVLALAATGTSAATMEMEPEELDPVEVGIEGNDVGNKSDLCEKGFDTCVSPGGSPVIAKFDQQKFVFDDVNSLWDGLFDADDFKIKIEGDTVVWSYSGPIGISEVTVKYSNVFDYYALEDDKLFNDNTWLFKTGDTKDISHITFWDTDGPSEIPLPAAGWLLMASVGGLAAMRRRKKS